MQRLPGAIFQQGNARPHTTKVSKDCLHTLTTLPWPARSPDLSPIKHIWDHLGRRVGHPSSLNELEARYYCTQGYSLISENKPYDGINECLANKTWSGISHKISCAGLNNEDNETARRRVLRREVELQSSDSSSIGSCSRYCDWSSPVAPVEHSTIQQCSIMVSCTITFYIKSSLIHIMDIEITQKYGDDSH
ncbi:transposable element Tcb2 transposase [Trichonephila clavipes]|uniref:Transposable element Tcb2 transposase n=1 Tax=Trichonephila clavipes TaxID=2585209 RepID=A0A8X6RHE2_TRICX|nr:transposable element Tcb2 transposase [Trichonephila clavipes]